MRNSGGKTQDSTLSLWKDQLNQDMLIQFDIAVPDGAYINSAHIELTPERVDAPDDDVVVISHAIAKDMLEGGKQWHIDHFENPKNYLKDVMKPGNGFLGHEYEPVKLKLDEDFVLDVTRIIPFELNDQPLFQGTLAFVLTFTVYTGQIDFHMSNPKLKVEFGRKGKFLLRMRVRVQSDLYSISTGGLFTEVS